MGNDAFENQYPSKVAHIKKRPIMRKNTLKSIPDRKFDTIIVDDDTIIGDPNEHNLNAMLTWSKHSSMTSNQAN